MISFLKKDLKKEIRKETLVYLECMVGVRGRVPNMR